MIFFFIYIHFCDILLVEICRIFPWKLEIVGTSDQINTDVKIVNTHDDFERP